MYEFIVGQRNEIGLIISDLLLDHLAEIFYGITVGILHRFPCRMERSLLVCLMVGMCFSNQQVRLHTVRKYEV